MANGFFLGGMAEGMSNADKQALAERTQTEDTGLRGRALDIQARTLDRAAQQDIVKRADEQIASTMGVVGDTIKNAMAVGKDPATIQKAVMPLVESAKAIAGRVGRDPRSLDAQVQAQLFQPTGTEAAAAAGAAAATSTIAQNRTLNAAGIEGAGIFKTVEDRVKAEDSLRDDYLKASQPFITSRDAKNRIDSIQKSGAGDVALLYSYMKILDPGSTVREGEVAMAQNAAGVPAQILNLYNRALTGERLPEGTRNDIKNQAEKIYQAQAKQHDKLTTQFAETAKRRGMNVRSAVPDLLPAGAETAGETPSGLKYRVLQ